MTDEQTPADGGTVAALVQDLRERAGDHSERLSDFEDGYSTAMRDAAEVVAAALPTAAPAQGDRLTEGERKAPRVPAWACLACRENEARLGVEQFGAPCECHTLAARQRPEADGEWVCGVCGEGRAAHSAGGSRHDCAFSPVWKPTPRTEPVIAAEVHDPAIDAVRRLHRATTLTGVAGACWEGDCEHPQCHNGGESPEREFQVCKHCSGIAEESGLLEESWPAWIMWPCATASAIGYTDQAALTADLARLAEPTPDGA